MAPVQGSSLPCEMKPHLPPAHITPTLHEHCLQRTQRGPEPLAQGVCEIIYSSSILLAQFLLTLPLSSLVHRKSLQKQVLCKVNEAINSGFLTGQQERKIL